ncbi:calcium-binding protein [Cyanobium sp. LEGE 06113]|uniref:calcium-binding protein n=1 Tax=Cyanobium sp. LEGE 06113 TaxID=1297573 RepID=UPI00187FA2C9|nr:calcium-binding protein [Cyanobium sp. LEGE 06113]
MTKPTFADAEPKSLVYLAVEIGNDHPVPQSWKERGVITDEDESTGYARILIDTDSSVIHRMEMNIDGVFLSDDGDSSVNILEQNFGGAQPFHFHNQPQGGPNFFVQQLFDYANSSPTTASFSDTSTGFSFRIDEPYALRDPINAGGNLSLTKEFVVQEILDKNAYLGIHTRLYPIPVTPLAGDLNVLSDSTINGVIRWLDGENNITIGGSKNDLLSLGAGSDRGFGGNGNDVLDGGSDNDKLLGGNGHDNLWGGDGNDVLVGGRGKDIINGNRDRDRLFGGAGNDGLLGGAGNDLLIGGKGNDTMTGGAGRDTFLFKKRSGKDVITDFDQERDVLKLSPSQAIRSITFAKHTEPGGGDTVINLLNGQISILNIDLTTVDGWAI